MFDSIRADLHRHLRCDGREDNSLIWKIFIVSFAYGFHASTVYRYGSFIDRRLQHGIFYPIYLLANIFYLFGKILTEKMYGIAIDRKAVIGKGFYIGHFGGIKIAHCYIGKNCNVHQLVKIRDGCTVGDNVWIGGHAVLEKGVSVADQATVMVGARVTSSVCHRCLVSGVPARVINRNYENKGLLGL